MVDAIDLYVNGGLGPSRQTPSTDYGLAIGTGLTPLLTKGGTMGHVVAQTKSDHTDKTEFSRTNSIT